MRAPISVFTGLALASIIGTTLLAIPKGDLLPESAGPSVATYRVDVSSSNLENGDFYTNAGTRLHFNEDGVIEGSYIEIAPLGGLYLTTPIWRAMQTLSHTAKNNAVVTPPTSPALKRMRVLGTNISTTTKSVIVKKLPMQKRKRRANHSSLMSPNV